MDRGAWWATVQGVTKNWTRLKQLNTHTHCIAQGTIFNYLVITYNEKESEKVYIHVCVCIYI